MKKLLIIFSLLFILIGCGETTSKATTTTTVAATTLNVTTTATTTNVTTTATTTNVTTTTPATTSTTMTPATTTAAISNQLGSTALSMIAGLANLFTVTPDEIILNEIGEINSTISQIDSLTGNGYMNDEDIITSSTFNTLTAPEYLEIVDTYNSSLSTMNSYLAIAVPMLANITEYETEYSIGGFIFSMSKPNDDQYQISISGTILMQPIQISIIVDELSLLDNFMYSIEFTTDIATWYYEIVRDLTGVQSIAEVIEFLGDNLGVVYANVFFIDGNNLNGIIFKDEISVTRRMYFEFNETTKGIYYLNDDTGTEKYISLNTNGDLVFEYENYQPNIPLVGSEKVRYSLDQFSGIDSIEFNDGFFSNSFNVNGTIDITESSTFNIEAKEYVVYLYDDVNQVYSDEIAGNWFLRIEGDYESDFDSFFEFEDFMTPLFNYDVEQHIINIENNKDSITIFGINAITITKEEILAGME
ncbi:hypothetical protein RJI07_04030 [Mycoplasmatota bacterium WC30]